MSQLSEAIEYFRETQSIYAKAVGMSGKEPKKRKSLQFSKFMKPDEDSGGKRIQFDGKLADRRAKFMSGKSGKPSFWFGILTGKTRAPSARSSPDATMRYARSGSNMLIKKKLTGKGGYKKMLHMLAGDNAGGAAGLMKNNADAFDAFVDALTVAG
jgi:hypothetical protein